MKIATVGTGYIGLVTGNCFSEIGIDVTCVDIQKCKVENLKKGIIPIYEPGLEDMVHRDHNVERLKFATDLKECLDGVEVIFSAVGTPPDEDDSADSKYVLGVTRTIGRNINKYVLAVAKSTVPVGTTQKVGSVIQGELDKRNVLVDFDVASNPKFLKEGDAADDFTKPDCIVVGIESERAKEIVGRLYKPSMMNNYRLIFTNIPSAEMIKYAANSVLATRISFTNDIANLCELVGVDVDMVRKGIGANGHIGSRFLYPNCSYGGSCFPKDVKALIKTAEKNGYSMYVLKSVEEVNERQKNILFEKLLKHYNGDIQDEQIILWRLAFKPETGDMREAPSLVLIQKLFALGTTVKVYDPIAMDECRRRTREEIFCAVDVYDSVLGSDALMLVIEWKEFRMPGQRAVRKTMKSAVVVDGRNICDKKELLEVDSTYYCIGK